MAPSHIQGYGCVTWMWHRFYEKEGRNQELSWDRYAVGKRGSRWSIGRIQRTLFLKTFLLDFVYLLSQKKIEDVL
jgi:hypothetical protein